ncbi:MAG: DUF6488 family protein [Oligoflexales bacterium]
MKKILLTSIATIFFLIQSPVFAHSDHHHKKPVSEEIAKNTGNANIRRLIKEKKLLTSWEQAEFLKIEKKKFGSKKEWVLTFINKKIEDKNKKILYIFLKLSGEFVAANYTGK